MKFKREKLKYCIEVSRHKTLDSISDAKVSGRRPVWYFRSSKYEALLDAYWAFIFSDAKKVVIRNTGKRSKVYCVINNLDDWHRIYEKQFGDGRYMVWADRY